MPVVSVVQSVPLSKEHSDKWVPTTELLPREKHLNLNEFNTHEAPTAGAKLPKGERRKN